MSSGLLKLRQFLSFLSDLAAEQKLVAGDLTVDLTNPNVVTTYLLNKGSAAAITLGVPVVGLPSAGGNDGQRLTFITLTAQAHVITQSTVGFNAKAASGTATFTAAKGNNLTIEAYNGNWYAVSRDGVTIA